MMFNLHGQLATILSTKSCFTKICTHFSLFNRSLHTNPRLNDNFLSLLPFCRKGRDLKAFNSLLILHGLIGHKPLVKQFINQCCHLGFPELALSAFRTIEKPSLYLQNLVLRRLCDNGFFEDVIFVYKKCRYSGLSSDNYTYPFVIKACTASRDVWFGNAMHCVVLKTGFGDNLVVGTALLSFYSRVSEIGNARKMIDEIPQPDLVTWNALISGYSVNAFDYEALQVFQNLRVMGVKPNASTLTSLLPLCSRLGFNGVGVSLHGLAYKLGFMEVESLLPALISIYANCGDLFAARKIFNASTRKDVAIWNSMISAYTRTQKPENAVSVFQKMLMDEVKPNVVTFVSLLPSSENLDSILYLESFHACVVKFRYEKEPSVVTALVSVYSKLGNMESAEFLFHNMKVRNLLLWKTMLSSCANHGLSNQSLDVFSLMQMDGFVPDAISIVSLLSSFSKLKATLLGKSAHAFVIRKSIDSNLNVLNALLAFYCDCSELVYSFRIFDRMVLKNVVSWNTMISRCVENGELEGAMLLLHEMRQEGVDFDLITLISILPSCHESRNQELGLAIHGYAIRTALKTDISLANAIVSMYINCGQLNAARLFFDDMPDKSVVSWNAILTGYRCHNLHKESMELFHDMMIEENQKPNYVTLLNILPACETLHQVCAHLNNLSISDSVLSYLFRKGLDKDVAISNGLIDMYAKCGSISSAKMLFEMLSQKDTISWSVMINSCGLHGDSEAALSLYSQMRLLGFKPDKVTYMSILSACSHSGCIEEGKMVFDNMIRDGVSPGMEHYGCMVDMLCRRGQLKEAYEIVKNLPDGKSCENLLESLLGGCLSHGEHGLGEEIGRVVVAMNPQQTAAAAYVILHNIYAASGKWVEANNVRLLMEHNKFRKTSGVSYK
ncbi:hypothetical protein ACS0TY_030128 [Phlomoides rotata]